MSLQTAINIVEIIVVVAASMALGDYLGYKVGRWKLVAALGIITLAAIVLFAVYAAIVLA